MDSEKVRNLIKVYKREFDVISKSEIYKWRAVKCFQDNWNINSSEFSIMLENSFALTKSLLDAGNYFPRRMLFKNAKREPETVRQLFVNLYNEEENITDRIEAFKNGINCLTKKYFPGKKSYQDERAVIVYLCLKYPDIYYLYKFTMFKWFLKLIDEPYHPKQGSGENIIKYRSICNDIRNEIVKDDELLELHKTRIGEGEYYDSSFNLLTQDVIYASVRYVDLFRKNKLIKVKKIISPKLDKVVLKGFFTNHIENEKAKKETGNFGELLVLQYEQEKLERLGINKIPEHKSKSEGDGLGYDILSYDEKGEEIFIEVKTTSKGANVPFFITCNELEKSKQESDRYFLYRLYDFDELNNNAKFFIQKGDLTKLCLNPIKYKVIVG